MNGGGPPDRVLQDGDYQVICGGECVTEGEYAGCILVDEVYYWVAPDDELWALYKGEPSESMCAITTGIWNRCKDGGSFEWDSENEVWLDRNRNPYRWGGKEGEDIELVQVEL